MNNIEFNEKEISELIQWFRDRWSTLPERLQINEWTKTENLKFTVKATVEGVKATIDRPSVCMGYVATLVDIKNQLDK